LYNAWHELISSPSLLFLDEPTTGLDSFQADKVSDVITIVTYVYIWGVATSSSPSLLFLDEPTTGLDSFQAEKVRAVITPYITHVVTQICKVS
jgi:ABC-type multidrug transport system ATPase subunit